MCAEVLVVEKRTGVADFWIVIPRRVAAFFEKAVELLLETDRRGGGQRRAVVARRVAASSRTGVIPSVSEGPGGSGGA